MKRFWDKVQKGEPEECWEWTAGCNEKGYGLFHIKGRGSTLKAHRIAYEMAHGKAPEGVVMHTCDNPACCNPAHLRVGTQFENIQDRQAKGRHDHKLSAEDCKTIRHLYYAEQCRIKDIAAHQNVTPGAIHYRLKQGAYDHG